MTNDSCRNPENLYEISRFRITCGHIYLYYLSFPRLKYGKPYNSYLRTIFYERAQCDPNSLIPSSQTARDKVPWQDFVRVERALVAHFISYKRTGKKIPTHSRSFFSPPVTLRNVYLPCVRQVPSEWKRLTALPWRYLGILRVLADIIVRVYLINN